jgi:hypothetical protein
MNHDSLRWQQKIALIALAVVFTIGLVLAITQNVVALYLVGILAIVIINWIVAALFWIPSHRRNLDISWSRAIELFIAGR